MKRVVGCIAVTFAIGLVLAGALAASADGDLVPGSPGCAAVSVEPGAMASSAFTDIPGVVNSSALIPPPTGSGCFYACFDLETSEGLGCPPGQNYALLATGGNNGCCFVPGGGMCVETCDGPAASECKGFASGCGASCGGGFGF